MDPYKEQGHMDVICIAYIGRKIYFHVHFPAYSLQQASKAELAKVDVCSGWRHHTKGRSKQDLNQRQGRAGANLGINALLKGVAMHTKCFLLWKGTSYCSCLHGRT